jgi:arsenite methyltransferase
MASEALRQFQQRFLSAAAETGIDLHFFDRQIDPWNSGTRWIEAGERLLILGLPPTDVLDEMVRRVGSEGSVLVVAAPSERVPGELQGSASPARRPGFVLADWADLRTDLERVDELLKQAPVRGWRDLLAFQDRLREAVAQRPLIEDSSIDRCIAGPLPNLLPPARLAKVYSEIARVLRRTGTLVVTGLVSDEPVDPAWIQRFVTPNFPLERIPVEEELLAELEHAGFHGLEIVDWEESPPHTLSGMEIRQVTIRAFQGKQGPCFECNHAVIYRGPWKQVQDDDNHILRRGQRIAVCEKTYRLLTSQPYASEVLGIEPWQPVAVEKAAPFPCRGGTMRRDPRVTKGFDSPPPEPVQEGCCGDDCSC